MEIPQNPTLSSGKKQRKQFVFFLATAGDIGDVSHVTVTLGPFPWRSPQAAAGTNAQKTADGGHLPPSPYRVVETAGRE